MLAFTDATPIYLFTAPTDMRKSFDGLSGLIARHLGASSVTDGSLFVFINRRRDRMKVMGFDGDGLAIWYKRLEEGRYELPMNPMDRCDVRIDARQLRLILDGIDLGSVKRRKRYAKPPARNALDLPSAEFRGVTDDDRTTHRTIGTARRVDRRTERDGGQAARRA